MIVRELLTIFMIFVSSRCYATSLVDRDVGPLFDGAASVIEGDVVGVKAYCDNAACFSEVTVSVDKVYKGSETRGEKTKFCSYAPLSVGFEYIFFVDAAESGAGKARCRGVVERDAVFSRFGNSVYRYMSPGSFNTAKIDGAEYLTGWILAKEFDSIVSRDR